MKLIDTPTYVINGNRVIADNEENKALLRAVLPEGASALQGKEQTLAYRILKAHNHSGNMEQLNIRFDKLTSHDITFVGIIQTARASGLTSFPVPYALTNCHNSLCAVGGTINEDDHMFGLSCAKKYGGIYVPPHQAVIHQFAREMLAACGAMILGSDSHTRYGALGTMAIGEGGPEIVKQLLEKTYDIDMPKIVGVHLTGKPRHGVGPQDIALAVIGAVFENGFVNNKVMEFFGEGVHNLSVDYRIGIDVMTTETTCLSSIWETDDLVKAFYELHGRANDYKALTLPEVVYYDRMIEVNLSEIKPMIAMPFHPSNVYTIDELNENLLDILHDVEEKAKISLDTKEVSFTLTDKVKNGHLYVDQGVIAGCAGGGFENICDAADILDGRNIGNDAFSLSVYPASQPILMELTKNGRLQTLLAAGATMRTAFCGPCFGAGDVPSNKGFSIRHSTRNFPNREGSKITNGQIASVALMDARSIAATAANQGCLTSAEYVDTKFTKPKYDFDASIYKNRVYNGVGEPKDTELRFGPGIVDWPHMEALSDNILLKVVSVIMDPVTTTDELIPSGETSSYRSNPLKLAEFTLSRKDPAYVGLAKGIQAVEKERLRSVKTDTEYEVIPETKAVLQKIEENFPVCAKEIQIGSTIYANKPGDGSAREQAASCQRVLGGLANIAKEYATKRYRSNLINWGMIPFITEQEPEFYKGDYIFIPKIRKAVFEKSTEIAAWVVSADSIKNITLKIGNMTDDERRIILDGCLINTYRGTKNA